MLPNNVKDGDRDGYKNLYEVNRFSFCMNGSKEWAATSKQEDLFTNAPMKQKQDSQRRFNLILLGLWSMLFVAIATLLVQASSNSPQGQQERVVTPVEKLLLLAEEFLR